MPEITWNDSLYQSQHQFVSQYGMDLTAILAAQSHESILDLGCGTGELTAQIAKSGAQVIGIDSAPNMIERAKNQFPTLTFEVISADKMNFNEDFHAVFSNATFHWIEDQHKLLSNVRQSLKSGGRLVAEFGAKGNVKQIMEGIEKAARNLGLEEKIKKDFWFFPTVGKYASKLEECGFEVNFASSFERPTSLKGKDGMQLWINQFAGYAFKELSIEEADAITDLAVQILKPTHFKHEQWVADYKRIQVVATKQG